MKLNKNDVLTELNILTSTINRMKAKVRIQLKIKERMRK